MAYMRGDIYVWQGNGDAMHLWSATGNDGWKDSVWGADRDDQASGVEIPMAIFDELVAMRFAELLEEHSLRTTLERAVQRWKGNFGCTSLVKLQDRIAQLDPTPADELKRPCRP